MGNLNCIVKDCANKNVLLNPQYCNKHYKRYRKYGNTLKPLKPKLVFAKTRAYRSWRAMKNRVSNSKSASYPYYGGRGIKVCERWEKSFLAFYEDMGERPSDKHSLDRINNNGDYEPSNCRWATHEVQVNNMSSNRLLTLKGQTKTQQQWSDELGLNCATIFCRLKKGSSVEEALTTPLRDDTPTPEEEKSIKKLRGQGYSIQKLAHKFKKHTGTIRKILGSEYQPLPSRTPKA